MRLRILVGTVILLLGLVIYGAIAAMVAVRFLSQNPLVEIAFYAIAGVVWILPAAWLTRWMQAAAPYRPPPRD